LGFLNGILSNRILKGFLGLWNRRTPPRWNLIQRSKRKPAQGANHSPVRSYSMRREHRPRRLVHEGHEFVRKSRHGAADTDATYTGTAAYAIHPSPFADITLHYWPPAPQLDNARRRSVLLGKISLLVIPPTIAAFMRVWGKSHVGRSEPSRVIGGALPAACWSR